jgi:hypothetical protein
MPKIGGGEGKMEITEFTIEVEKRGKDEDFDFGDLKMWHRECYGGRIVGRKFDKAEFGPDAEVDFPEPVWLLTCQRCHEGRALMREEPTAIVRTAIDGKPNTFKRFKINVFQRVSP